jgi:hypothetical protein
MRLTIAFLVIGVALFLTTWANAQTALASLQVLCPKATALAPHVEAAARQHMQRPVVLVALMAVESNCRMDAVGAAGEVCAMQLRGVARNGHSKRALASNPALCVATGARWLSLREVDCGGGLFLGLSGYNARTCGGGKKYARKVLARVAQIWKAIAKMGAPRS